MMERSAGIRFGLAALMISIMTPGLALAQNDKSIDVEIVSGVTGFMLVFNNQECPPGWQEDDGCVYQARGRSGMIRWQLAQHNTAEGWALERLYLGTAPKSWGVGGHHQGECILNDFGMSGSDVATGEVSYAVVHGGGRFLDVRNRNECEAEYYVHHKLTAVNRNTGETAESDPIISNGGRR